MRGEPMGARKMGVVSAPCSVGLSFRVEVEHDPGDLVPGRAVRLGVQQPQIGRQMRPIVVGDLRIGRRGLSDWRV